MKLKEPTNPSTGRPAIGIIKHIYGVAKLAQLDVQGGVEYAGGTEIAWDSSATVRDELGRVLLTDGEDEWYSEVEEGDM